MSEREVSDCNCSRAQRYAKAMGTPLPQPTGKRIRRIEAVMAVADAEIAQVQEEAEGWAESHAEAFSAWHETIGRAESAEAKLARVEALCESAEQNLDEPRLWASAIRTALA